MFELITVTSDDKIIIADCCDWEGEQAIALDASTGNLIWESEHIGNLDSLHADDQYVYVGSITFVRAYDLQTGQRQWEGAKQPAFKRGGLNVYANGEQLEVYDPYNNHKYILDTETGETVADGVRGSGQWTYGSLGGSSQRWPVVDNILFMNRDGQLVAIDITTAKTVWQSTEAGLITTIAFDGSLLYALRDDAAIVAFDPKTGESVGAINMVPDQAPPTNNGGYITYYTIAASDKFVVVYYGDSQELIVFEKSIRD